MAMDKQGEHVADEVQDLVWALVDEYATDSQISRLEELLLGSEEARRTYVMCMQMHADLYFLLGGRQSRLAAGIEELLKSDTGSQPSKGRQPAKGANRPLPSLPIADLPPSTQDMPHSNGMSH
jgi:hypothetical protein